MGLTSEERAQCGLLSVHLPGLWLRTTTAKGSAFHSHCAVGAHAQTSLEVTGCARGIFWQLCSQEPVMIRAPLVNQAYPVRNKFFFHEATEMCIQQQMGLTRFVHIDFNPAYLICTFA